MNAKKIFVTTAGLLLAVYISYAQDAQNPPDAPPASTNFVGVGLELGVGDNCIVVAGVLPNTSADQAHVQPGSTIKAVNGVSTDGMKIQECVNRIRGPESTTVALELANPTKTATNTVQLTRQMITVPAPPSPNPNPNP